MVRYVASTLQCGLYGISTRLMFNLAIVEAVEDLFCKQQVCLRKIHNNVGLRIYM